MLTGQPRSLRHSAQEAFDNFSGSSQVTGRMRGNRYGVFNTAL